MGQLVLLDHGCFDVVLSSRLRPVEERSSALTILDIPSSNDIKV